MSKQRAPPFLGAAQPNFFGNPRMTFQADNQPLDNVVLTQAIETVVRPLVRIAIGKVSLVKLVELLELIFVEEAEQHLKTEFPGKSAPMTHLGLLTELDTRTVHRIRKHPAYQTKRRSNSPFMNSFTPTTRLLDKWSTDRRYRTGKSGKPLTIAMHGECPSIEHLMKVSRFARGVTPKSVVDRLELSNAVTVDRESGRLSLRTDRYLPQPGKDQEGAAEVGMNAVHRLLHTVLENLQAGDAENARKFQRCYWTNRLPINRQAAFQKKMNKLMAGFEQEATELLIRHEAPEEQAQQLTAGFGVYYFEDEPLPQGAANRDPE